MASSTSSDSAAQYALQRFGLQGKKCLVTGGSKGIGAAIVEHYCRLGAEVREMAGIGMHVSMLIYAQYGACPWCIVSNGAAVHSNNFNYCRRLLHVQGMLRSWKPKFQDGNRRG